MNLLLILDVLISLSLVYLAASLFVTIANEYFAQLSRARAAHLKASLEKILDNAVVRDDILNYPAFQDARASTFLSKIISKLFRLDTNPMVSYLDTEVAAKVIIGSLSKGKTTDFNLKEAIDNMWNSPFMGDTHLHRTLVGIASETDDDIKEFTKQLS